MDVTAYRPNDVDDGLIREVFALHQAVHAADTPPDSPPPLWEPFRLELRQDHPELTVERWTARINGQLAGEGVLTLPLVDNTHIAEISLRVAPTYRRHGVGRAVLDQLLRRADAHQRTTVLASGTRAIPGGPPCDDAGVKFLPAMGFTPGLHLIRRRLHMPAIDQAAEQALLEECRPHAAPYQWRSWTGLTPADLADGVAHLVNRLVTDAPTGDVPLDEPTVSAQRLHADERKTLQRQTQLAGVAARHRDTGEVAALTGVRVTATGEHASVLLTIVEPRHRGHRLGTIIKIELHRLLRQTYPQLRYVYTGNAGSNVHMVRINEQLGFVPYQAATLFQLARPHAFGQTPAGGIQLAEQ